MESGNNDYVRLVDTIAQRSMYTLRVPEIVKEKLSWATYVIFYLTLALAGIPGPGNTPATRGRRPVATPHPIAELFPRYTHGDCVIIYS